MSAEISECLTVDFHNSFEFSMLGLNDKYISVLNNALQPNAHLYRINI